MCVWLTVENVLDDCHEAMLRVWSERSIFKSVRDERVCSTRGPVGKVQHPGPRRHTMNLRVFALVANVAPSKVDVFLFV